MHKPRGQAHCVLVEFILGKHVSSGLVVADLFTKTFPGKVGSKQGKEGSRKRSFAD